MKAWELQYTMDFGKSFREITVIGNCRSVLDWLKRQPAGTIVTRYSVRRVVREVCPDMVEA